jgi:hypothetical protein
MSGGELHQLPGAILLDGLDLSTHCFAPALLLLCFMEACRFINRGEVEDVVVRSMCQAGNRRATQDVVDGVEPKRNIVVVLCIKVIIEHLSWWHGQLHCRRCRGGCWHPPENPHAA